MELPVTERPQIKTQRFSRKERENLRQRAEIIQVALRLFSDNGYHNVSMSQIAAEAEFGIGTLYKFFENKESLYKTLIMEKSLGYHYRIMNAMSEPADPPTAIINFICVRHDVFFSNLPLMKLYFAETSGTSFNIKAGMDKDLRKLYDDSVRELASILERGIGEGFFRALDPQYMALSLMGAINSILWDRMDSPEQGKDLSGLSTVAEIFLGGVLVSGNRTASELVSELLSDSG